jgi:hypothetical protein
MDNRAFINEMIQYPDARILEIGPLNRPVICKEQFPRTLYCDIRSTEEIHKLYSGNDYLNLTGLHVDLDTIVNIDVVIKNGYAKTFENQPKFDYIIASHVAEHMEDIIGFLLDASDILCPKGRLCLIYPDQRYCFDHFRQEASFRDAYAVYRKGRAENARMVLDFFYSGINVNDPFVFWKADHLRALLPRNDVSGAIAHYDCYLLGEAMDDVHYWPFSDRGFVKFLYDCARAGLFPYTCKDFHPTQENTQEFLTVLELNPHKNPSAEMENLSQKIDLAPLNFHHSGHIANAARLAELEQLLDHTHRQNAALSDHNTALTAQLEQTQAANTALTARLEQAQAANTALTAQLEQAHVANTALTAQSNQSHAEIHELSRQFASAQAENTRLAAQIHESRQNRDALQAQISELLQTIREIQNSTSWRVTKPLRALGGRLKKT